MESDISPKWSSKEDLFSRVETRFFPKRKFRCENKNVFVGALTKSDSIKTEFASQEGTQFFVQKEEGKKIELVFIVTFPFSALRGTVFSLENFEAFR